MTEPHLQVERDGHVVTVTMNRPERKNAFSTEMLVRLYDAWTMIDTDDEVRVAILTGAGGDFCSGADLSDAPEGSVHHLARMRAINAVIQAFHELPQPTIAKVDGVAAGVGMNLALGCDLVVASDRSRFSEIFARRGLNVVPHLRHG